MAETKYTPGPWFTAGASVYANEPQDVDPGRFKGFHVKEEPEGGYLVAESCVHEGTRNLIAAAPELYELLKEADRLTLWEMTSVPDGFQERVEAAIAKAEGRPLTQA